MAGENAVNTLGLWKIEGRPKAKFSSQKLAFFGFVMQINLSDRSNT